MLIRVSTEAPHRSSGKRSPEPPPPPPTAPVAEDDRTDLRALLEGLGPDIVEVVTAPQGLDVVVGEPVIFDPTEHGAIGRGAIVLAVGLGAGAAEIASLFEEAADADAAAVVIKQTGRVGTLAERAEAAGVALLSVPEEMTWTQLHTFLLNARRFASQLDTGQGIAGVPIGDLFAFANACAEMVGGAVTIEDPARRVLAYSTHGDQPIDAGRRRSILGLQVPDSTGIRSLYRQVLESAGVITFNRRTLRKLLDGAPFELHDLQPRSAVAIRAGSQTIGTIWVAHEAEALSEGSSRSLADAARIATPHVIQARAAHEVERRMRAEMLLSVLEGRASAEEAAARLGFVPGTPLAVIAFRPLADPPVDQLRRERLVDLVLIHCDATYRQTAAVAIGRTIYALVQGEGRFVRERLLRLAKEIQLRATTRLDIELIGAASSPVDHVRGVSDARREVERVLDVLQSDVRRRTVASIDDVRSEVVLRELKDLTDERPDLTRGKLVKLLEHDAETGSSYALTLRAYFDAFGEAAVAAQQITVHPNTFRYRMRRLMELFDLDLANPDERLVLELQLRLLDDGRSGEDTAGGPGREAGGP
jgi:DNA-binding PucR family transcriptional regulator